MSQRQGRRSSGLPPLGGGGGGMLFDKPETVLTETQRFEDFRRRHAKQNKEIILDNVNRKTAIKSLQDDIASLQAELLQVRQANLVLQAKVKRMHRDAGKLGGQPVKDALDQLIHAVPALRQLRDALTTINPPPSHEKDKSPIFLATIENTYATRPAAAARQTHGLGALVEGSECGSEGSAGDEELRRARRRSRGRHTDVGSVAASRSPRPTQLARPDVKNSPNRTPSSPSPRKQHTHNVSKQQKRRRQSGLLPPRQRSESPRVTPDREEEPISEPIFEIAETSEWEEGGLVEIKPDEAKAFVQDVVAVDELKIGDVARPTEIMSTIVEGSSEGGSGSSRSHQSSQPITSSPTSDSNADEPARGRRARQSVNYKEPSLNKKMRKPDGISAEEALKPISNSRKSMAPDQSQPTTPKRGSSRATTPRRGEHNDTPPPPLPEMDATRVNEMLTKKVAMVPVARGQQGMRRKSVLPKAGGGGAGAGKAGLGGEDDEEDDVDALIGYEEIEHGRGVGSGSGLKGETKVNGSSSADKLSTTTAKHSFRPTSTVSASAKQASLGIGRPIMPPPNARIPSTPATGTIQTTSRNFTPAAGTGKAHRVVSADSGKPTTATRRERDVLAEMRDNITTGPMEAGVGKTGMRASSAGAPRRRISSAV
ncbi:hypothetical protein CI109_101226 [Kwoniella shandongensis]|uniref:Shugoshin C-terminal domain-containing protein n=1 Tax=Kwoniella shandongensis TaxID=1734106 RepID=A0A5M6BTP4_9TREE|nr:uncharacterized protein CI109_005455 [Kwoniella shandongensis]KAA5526177.1 hypothetical protein CI109_005455 [Kwoniella shandongensis]